MSEYLDDTFFMAAYTCKIKAPKLRGQVYGNMS